MFFQFPRSQYQLFKAVQWNYRAIWRRQFMGIKSDLFFGSKMIPVFQFTRKYYTNTCISGYHLYSMVKTFFATLPIHVSNAKLQENWHFGMFDTLFRHLAARITKMNFKTWYFTTKCFIYFDRLPEVNIGLVRLKIKIADFFISLPGRPKILVPKKSTITEAPVVFFNYNESKPTFITFIC